MWHDMVENHHTIHDYHDYWILLTHIILISYHVFFDPQGTSTACSQWIFAERQLSVSKWSHLIASLQRHAARIGATFRLTLWICDAFFDNNQYNAYNGTHMLQSRPISRTFMNIVDNYPLHLAPRKSNSMLLLQSWPFECHQSLR